MLDNDNMETYTRKQGDKVKFTIPFQGEGVVEGLAMDGIFGLGVTWVVRITCSLPPGVNYPFTHIVVADAWMRHHE